MTKKHMMFILMISFMQPGTVLAQDFGRLFTTPTQRQQLDELRRTQTDVRIEIMDEEVTVEQNTVVEQANTGDLRLKGLVFRNDGKNTAWINDSNSYEGDLSSQYTSVMENGVSGSQVKIGVAGADGKDLSLKVGQSFNPADNSVRDLLPETMQTKGTAVKPDDSN